MPITAPSKALPKKPPPTTPDMPEADLGHVGQRCMFEAMIRAFRLESPPLNLLAEIVHEIDLRDERYFYPEIAGINAVLQGWLLLDLSDLDLESRGLALFDSLFATLSTRFQPNDALEGKKK